ncbi:MAG: AAA family ATPase [Burkholderiales bacterium]
MYYQYFGLDRPPFKITPDTDFFFAGGNRGAVLEALMYAVTQGEGIVKVTGEVGSGKTMLCRMLQSRLPANIEQVYLANPSVSPEDILHAIAFELGLHTARDASRIELMHKLQEHLVKRHGEGRQVVVFVEESQSMPVATLEEIRLLSNLETQHHKLLQIVLFGQPELDEILAQPNIRQLRERIAHSFSLQPLRTEEIREYLMFRLRAAGYRGPDLFSPKLVRYIADTTGGLTRRVNLVADKALLAAFAGSTHTVTLAHVQVAVRDSEFSPKRTPGTSRWMPAIGLLSIGAALGIAAFWWLGGPRPVSVTAPAGVTSGNSSLAGQSASTTGSNASVAEVPAAGGRTKSLSASESPAAAGSAARMTPSPSSAAPAAPLSGALAPHSSNSDHLGPSTDSPPDVPADILRARLAATDDWLGKAGKNRFTIQLISAADNPDDLKRYLNYLGKFIESDEVYVYRTRIQGRSYLTVVYGTFPSRQAAQLALHRLPEDVKTYRPYVRSAPGIRYEAPQKR